MQKVYDTIHHNICYINVKKLMKNLARVTNMNKLYFIIAENFVFLIFLSRGNHSLTQNPGNSITVLCVDFTFWKIYKLHKLNDTKIWLSLEFT